METNPQTKAPAPAIAAPAGDGAARLAELQARQAAREAKRDADRAARELERAELIDKYEEELGPIGSAFALVDVREHGLGFIVVKKPNPASHKLFLAAIDAAITKKTPIPDTAIDRYILASLVHPDPAGYHAILGQVADIGHTCAAACRKMHAVGEEAAQGKS